MSTPSGEAARDDARATEVIRPGVPEPDVHTEPAEGGAGSSRGWWPWGKLPDHLGRARTSTVILVVLFLAIGLLYLNVRPEEQGGGSRPTGGTSDVEAPVQPSEPTPTETPTETSTEPTPTDDPDGTTTEAPTTTSPPSTTTSPSEPTTEAPTTTTGPEPTTDPDDATPTP
ncbi:hypothetical protein [Blastococcus sp. CCUG 61487]|uniref:hypothetical protein n=1 Tax=Blastococcus sp. CCUG 61487 TaxID=1840703 RepID=UPI0010C08479|nr:hypothetical protein [Blastococcus sp. CCUG 61487]TKJ34070.1 hypothetical protein A6V29_15400 [Blastococcus sp. CCUG 61487]